MFLTVLIAGVTQGRAQEAAPDVFPAINQEVLAHSAAFELLGQSAATIGHRLTGSANGRKAEQFVYDQLKGYGFTRKELRFQPFEVTSWSRGTVQLGLVQTGTTDTQLLRTVTLAHSPVSVNLQGELVDMGNGLEADYLQDPGKVKGKIVLASLQLMPGSAEGLRNLHRSEKTALAIKYGATGMILYNGVKNGVLLTGTASVTGQLNPIPALCITYEDGIHLQDLLKNTGYTAHISMSNYSGPIKARNVIASIPGTTYPKEKIIVCGHLDSWDLATGATDNGLGAFAIVDMARTFKKLHLRAERTIEFVLFMGEEQGLLGSTAYVEKAVKDGSLDQVKYVLNFDMAGNPVGFVANGRKEAGDFFVSTGAALHAIDTVFSNKSSAGNAGLHSDHEPFLLQGIPTATSVSNMPSSIYGCYHADCDDMPLIKKEWMVNQVRFSCMMIYTLANARALPALRQTDAETKQFLVDNKLKEALQIAGHWRWKD